MSAGAPEERSLAQLFDLRGRVAMVTGAATGIGRQMASALAEAGADVMLCARNEERCLALAEELTRRFDVRAVGMRCDVARPEEVQAVVDRAVEELGGLDVLVNNAGTTWGAPAEDYPLDGWRKVLDVNLTGTFLCSQAAGRVMLARGRGKIVNIASGAALRGADPAIRQAVGYSASKGGVVAFTKDLACQWASRGIHVNAIAPGWFPTAIAQRTLDTVERQILDGIPLRRLGGADDLKGAVVFLASGASDYVTGQTLVVDGGKSVW